MLNCGVEKRNIDIVEIFTPYNYGAFKVEPFGLVHNVANIGWKIHFASGIKVLYATDTNSIEHVKAKGYDYYFLEANYTEKDIIERIKRKQETGEHVYEWEVLENHLSYERAMDFIYRNIGANGRYVLLHQHKDTQ